ncbi:MAG: hypothetical protein ACLUD1_04475 [Clostridia bacterium]
MEKIKRMLDEEIKTEIQELSKYETGSKEKSAAIEDLATLYRLKIEENEKEDSMIIQDFECKLKEDQKSEQIKDRYFRLGIAAAELVLPLVFYAFWMRRGFKFEETGTYTSTTFRGLFNRFRPTKK